MPKSYEIAREEIKNIETVSKIACGFIRQGTEEFTRIKWTSHNQNLSIEEESELLAHYQEKAGKGQMVEISEIRTAYDKAIGKESDKSTIYYVLHRHDW